MKKLFFFLVLLTNNLSAQTLTIQEMIVLTEYSGSNTPFESLDKLILDKGFEFLSEKRPVIEGLGRSKRYNYQSCKTYPVGIDNKFREVNSVSVDSINNRMVVSFTTSDILHYHTLISEIDSLGFSSWYGDSKGDLKTKDYYSEFHTHISLTITTSHPTFENKTYSFYTVSMYLQ